MIKRIFLLVAFTWTFVATSALLTNSAQAWRGSGRPYGAYYYGPRAAYYGPVVVPYRAYYGPRIVRPYYPVYYGYPYAYPAYSNYYYGPPSGVSISVGF